MGGGRSNGMAKKVKELDIKYVVAHEKISVAAKLAGLLKQGFETGSGHYDYQYTPKSATARASMIASGEFEFVLGSQGIIGALQVFWQRDVGKDSS